MSAQGRDLASEVLAPGDGWASFGTGTIGGSLAVPEQIYVGEDARRAHRPRSTTGCLRGRPHRRPSTAPKIIYVDGTIDFNVDDADQPLSCVDYHRNGYTLKRFSRRMTRRCGAGCRPAERPRGRARRHADGLHEPEAPVHEDAARLRAAAEREVVERPHARRAEARRCPDRPARRYRPRPLRRLGGLVSSERVAVDATSPTPIPWEERPEGEAGPLWRFGAGIRSSPATTWPLEQHLQLGGAVPRRLRRRLPGRRPPPDDERARRLQPGRRHLWEIDEQPISFAPADDRVRDVQQDLTAFTTRASPGWRTATTSPGATATTARRSASRRPTTSRRSPDRERVSCPSTATACSSRGRSAASTRCSAARATTATHPSATSSSARAPT